MPTARHRRCHGERGPFGNLGYVFDDVERTGRSFSDMRDYTFRTSLDTLGNQYVTVRASYDHTARIGAGFSEASIEFGGLQPGLRFYDEADRDRDRGALLFVFNPSPVMDVTFQLTAGRDIYKGEGHEFGLLNNDNQSYNISASVSPLETITLGANYGREIFSSFQTARNANPPGTDYGSWFDPNRTSNLDNDEPVHNMMAYVDLVNTFPKTNIRLAYDFSESDQAFIHSGPSCLRDFVAVFVFLCFRGPVDALPATRTLSPSKVVLEPDERSPCVGVMQ